MLTQAEKGAAFHALHARAGAFIIPNPWDIGTARLLARLGFEALATTSAGYAFSVGQPDSTVGRDETMAHVAAIVSATDLPVSADLENGFGDTPRIVAETIKLAAQAGLVGGSIEDVSGRVNCTVYELGHAAERIRAAAEAVRHLPFRFTLTARAENFVVGRPDLNDTIARLQSYQEAGADVLYAPGLSDLDDIRRVVTAVDLPVNVLALPNAPTVAELAGAGVKRISVGGAFAYVGIGAVATAARELLEQGTYGFWATAGAGAAVARTAFTS